MLESHAEEQTFDSVTAECDLPLCHTYFPLGFPFELRTNSSGVLAAAAEAWSQFRQASHEPPVRLALAVSAGDAVPAAPTSKFCWNAHLMSMIADPENFLICDFNLGFAFASVTQRVAADHSFLRYRFLTPAANLLLQQRYLAPLHGALIARNGRGVLLCGESFAGKSTLAYACARAGWIFISDDATFLVRSREDLYAVGDPHTIRFREDSRHLFPELAHWLTIVRPNGKLAIEVFTRHLPVKIAGGHSIDHVVFLNRQPASASRVKPFSRARALEAWEFYTRFSNRDSRADQRASYERLLELTIVEMTYSGLDDALTCLESLVGSGD